MTLKFLNHEGLNRLTHSTRFKDALQDQISSNDNIRKNILRFVLADFLKRTSCDVHTKVNEDDLLSGYEKARRILSGLMTHCRIRREIMWLDFVKFIDIGRLLYGILNCLSRDIGYRSLFTYNFKKFIDSNFVPRAESSLSILSSYQEIYGRSLTPEISLLIWYLIAPVYPDLPMSQAISWYCIAFSNLYCITPLNPFLSVTQTISYCKISCITYCLWIFLRRL